MEIDSMPMEIDDIERRIRQLTIEKQAVKKEKDKASKERLEKIEEELANLTESKNELVGQWTSEKEVITGIRKLKEEIERLRLEEQKAEREGNLSRVAEIRYGKITEIEKSLKDRNAQLQEIQKHRKLLKEEVTEQEIAAVVSRWTGIPVSRMLEGEKEKLVKMESILEERVVGQNAAISAISDAVRRSRSGLQDPNRPMGTFIFLGPTGVGKTETAKAVASFLLTTRRQLCASTCRSTWKSTRWPSSSARLRATWAMTRGASSQRRFAAAPTRCSSSTRSKRRIPTCSTYFFSCLTRGGSPTPRGASWTSITRSSS